MAFGWFGKGKQGGAKALVQAHKRAGQARWAEALSFYEEAATDPACAVEAAAGARACRERLVTWNLEEAQAFANAQEAARCREHLDLALHLSGGEADLEARAREARDRLAAAPTEPAKPAPVTRMFPPTCGCGPACGSCDEAAATEAASPPGEELFEFYLHSLSAVEQQLLEHLDVRFQRGFVALQQGDLDSARPLLEAAAAAEPDLPGPAYALGLFHAVAGDTAAALRKFRRALALDPEIAPAVHHQAELLCEGERFGEAEALLNAWLKTHPEDVDAHFLLARSRDRSGDPAGALAALAEAERQAPAFDSRLVLARASLLLRQGDAAGALAAYQATATRNPDLLEALVPLGQLLLERGGAEAERAAKVFKHCRRLDPERGWWHLLQVAKAYLAAGWASQARDLLETVREELPDSEAAREQWQAVADRAGRAR